MRLAQTLAGSWTISTPNPEEEFCHTELAEFRTDATAEGSPPHLTLEATAAQTFVTLVAQFGGTDGEKVAIQSHSSEAVARMTALCEHYGLAEAKKAAEAA